MISMPRSQWGEGVELNSCNEPGLCVSWCQSVSEVFPIVDLKGSTRPECEDKTGGGGHKGGGVWTHFKDTYPEGHYVLDLVINAQNQMI